MKRQYLTSQHTTSVMGAEPTHITVTHPHHPLSGQKLELMDVLRGPNSRLVVKMPDGSRSHLPRDWTDYGCPDGGLEGQVTHLLPVEGFRELIKIIDQTEREALELREAVDPQ